jgi:hypothetical protein
MLDALVNGLLGSKQATRKTAPKSPSVEISIPKDHPGLPRLYKAAMVLPRVTVHQQSGVSYTKDGLYLPGALEEFLDALEAVIGEDHAQGLEEQLGLRESLAGSPADLQSLFGIASKIMPLGAMARMAKQVFADDQ